MAFAPVQSKFAAWAYASTRTITWDDPPIAGNLLIVQPMIGQGVAISGGITGFALIGSSNIDSTRTYMYWKIADGTEVSHTATWTATRRGGLIGVEYSFDADEIILESDVYGGDSPMDGEPGLITFTNDVGLLLVGAGMDDNPIEAPVIQNGSTLEIGSWDLNRIGAHWYQTFDQAAPYDKGEDLDLSSDDFSVVQCGFSEVDAGGSAIPAIVQNYRRRRVA
jgi:hypothetical protein